MAGGAGEAVVTTYPWGTYAAGWGLVQRAVGLGHRGAHARGLALLDQAEVDQALANAVYISPELNNGRLDLYTAIDAWRTVVGLN